MAAARKLNPSARGTLAAMDSQTDPMDVLRTVVSAQGAAKSLTKPTLDEAIALTAIFPPTSAPPIAGLRARSRFSPGLTPATLQICSGRMKERNQGRNRVNSSTQTSALPPTL